MFVSSMSALVGHVRAAECSVQTCTVAQTVEVDAAPLSCSLATAAVLDASAGTVVAADLSCPSCRVLAADSACLAA